MRLKIGLLGLGVFLFSRAAHTAVDLKKLFYVRECTIYTLAVNEVANLPGFICHFFADGSFVSVSTDGLTSYDKDNKINWKIPGYFHHQLRATIDESKVLAMTSENKKIEKKQIRFDKFLILNREGQILHQQSALRILEMAHLPRLKFNFTPSSEFNMKASEEGSHFNSFYEIPVHSNKKAYDKLPPAGFILNSTSLGIFILSPDLQRLIYHFKYERADDHFIHDVQVLANGNVLLYINQVTPAEFPHSAIHEIDLMDRTLKWEFTAQPKSFFFSEFCGGAQELDDDTVMFSDYTKGMFIVSKKEKKLKFYSHKIGTPKFDKVKRTQDFKAFDLKSFLKVRKISY